MLHHGYGTLTARAAVVWQPSFSSACWLCGAPKFACHPILPPSAGYRLREATLLFQTGDTGGARRMIQGVVRKVPAYAEAHACLAAVDWAQVGGRGRGGL